MNTPVSCPIAKLLREKGFDEPTFGFYSYSLNKYDTYSQLIRVNLLSDNYAAPTIAEVVMWLYEKHGIWISVKKDYHNGALLGFESMIDENDGFIDCGTFDTLIEAYEAAFEYALNKLI
jgi:hypothetical protein